MKLLIGQKRRITIPLELFEQTGFKEGETVDISLQGNSLVITKENTTEHKVQKIETTNDITSIQKPVKTDPGNVKPTKKGGNIVIKSNIKDKDKYTKPLFSKCGLVVRSKNRYIKDFCEVCKGELINGDSQKECVYKQKEENKSKSNKQVIHEIETNTKILQDKLDSNITTTNKTKTNLKGSTILQPVIINKGLKCCVGCGEYFRKGFLLDNYFYCKQCAKEDFINYIQNRKENN